MQTDLIPRVLGIITLKKDKNSKNQLENIKTMKFLQSAYLLSAIPHPLILMLPYGGILPHYPTPTDPCSPPLYLGF